MNETRKSRILAAVAMSVALAGLAGCGGDEAPAPTPAASTAPAPAAAPTPAAPAAAPTAPQTVPELLEAARAALRDQRYVSPPGNNSIEFYLKVLELQPDNRDAQVAVLDLMPQAQGSAEQMIEGGRLDEAQAAVALLKRAQPTSVVVTGLEQRIVNQRRADEQRRVAEEEAARLAERQAREQSAQTAAAQAAPPPAATPPRATAPAPAPATTAPAPATTPATAPPTQVASVSTPPPVSAQTAPQNKDFQLLKKVNASYPSQALRSRTEGWVELSFTITASGDVQDVEVVNANPRRVFDREAMRALSQWKFSPRIEGGKPVAARARQRLEFTLN
ncbi:MAG: energy transducer TonB [Lysobacterales bacterium]